jgi:hypothetical protein
MDEEFFLASLSSAIYGATSCHWCVRVSAFRDDAENGKQRDQPLCRCFSQEHHHKQMLSGLREEIDPLRF